jgi:hypothetical protein
MNSRVDSAEVGDKVSFKCTARVWARHHDCNEQNHKCRPATLPICPPHHIPFRMLIGEWIDDGLLLLDVLGSDLPLIEANSRWKPLSVRHGMLRERTDTLQHRQAHTCHRGAQYDVDGGGWGLRIADARKCNKTWSSCDLNYAHLYFTLPLTLCLFAYLFI